MSLKIEPFTTNDLEFVAGLQPEGWPDIFTSIQYYCTSEFCFPIKATQNGTVAGIGTAIIHGNTAWLAHIIVNKDFRNNGIGTTLTRSLIELIHKTPCRTLLLIATALGEPVYKKLGFEVDTQYVFFDDAGDLPAMNSTKEITPFQKCHEDALLQLDRSVSGEDRKKLLKDHFTNTQIFLENGTLVGFYMTTLGEGLIIANTPEAGVTLMKLRATSNKKFCIPINNTQGIDLLRQHGFKELRKASRMMLGNKLVWDSTKIYSRIGGNLG